MSYTKPKSGTEIALASKREAYTERLCKPNPVLSDMWERDAEAVLTLPFPPEVGSGGEVVGRSPLPTDHAGEIVSASSVDRSFELRNTLAQGATRTAEDASIRRADLLMQPSFNVAAMALDAADSINARNSIEKMLSH